MGLLGKLESFGKAAWDTRKELGDVAAVVKGLRAANAPILHGGQLVIAAMKVTTGIGEPEDGVDFGQGGVRLHGAAATLMSAQPTASWSGAGAGAYSVENVKQMTRTRAMAAADHEVHGVLNTEAFQVDFHRDRLDRWYNWLADVGLVTFGLGLIPGVGKGLKAAADAQAVLVAVGRSSQELDQLSSEVEENAAALQQLVGRYEKVGQAANLSDRGADQYPPPPPPPAPHERSPEDGSGAKPPEGVPTTPPSEQPPGSAAQFVAPMQTSGGGSGSHAKGGPPQAPPMGLTQVPASPRQETSGGGGTRAAPGAPPAGGMLPAAMSAGAAPMAPAPGVPLELIKEAVHGALKQEAERQAAEDEEKDEDGDGKPDEEEGKEEEDKGKDGKPDEEKDDVAAAPGGSDATRLTTPITVTVDSQNPIGPPPAPAP
jgi:hypothetical protein